MAMKDIAKSQIALEKIKQSQNKAKSPSAQASNRILLQSDSSGSDHGEIYPVDAGIAVQPTFSTQIDYRQIDGAQALANLIGGNPIV